MVGCNDDESLVLVLLVELVSLLNGSVEIEHLVNHCGCIIPVRCIVNLATLYHHEETLLLVLLAKEIYAGLCNLCKCQVILCAVNCIRYLLGNVLLVEHHLIGLLCLSLVIIISACNCVALLLGSAVKVVTLCCAALCIATCVEVIVGLQHPLCNLVVVVAVSVVCVECRWGSVVDAYRCCNTYSHTCVLGIKGDAVDVIALGISANAAVACLVAG